MTSQAWQRFVLQCGYRVPVHWLTHVLGKTVAQVQAVRRTGATRKRKAHLTYPDLFARWHGRAPGEGDWPKPGLAGATYEWQAPELALLATLVGQMPPADIAALLTRRLRKLSGDPCATRTHNAVQVRINVSGLQLSLDQLGGPTAAAAGREIGSPSIVQRAIEAGELETVRRGRYVIIPRRAWDAWKARRQSVPDGFVRLSTLKAPLAIKSDKLSEYARAGQVPGAVQINEYGTSDRRNAFGSWYVPRRLARKLIADRRAGRPMPWHGQPNGCNLKMSYRKWTQRRHPADCEVCAQAWGRRGPPATFEEFVARYPTLDYGAKRHITRVWDPGITALQLAARAKQPAAAVRRAIDSGTLVARRHGNAWYINRSDAARWIARGCPGGASKRSWITLPNASKTYGYSRRELHALIREGQLATLTGTNGLMRGVLYVSKNQCARLRARDGFTHAQAARRLRIPLARLPSLLKGVHWRGGQGTIPEPTMEALQRRIHARLGRSFEDAAKELEVSVAWIKERKKEGLIKVSRAPWDQRRVYISDPMFALLKAAKQQQRRRPAAKAPSVNWVRLTAAALEAGVSIGTIGKWAEQGMPRRRHGGQWRYAKRSIRARARQYWRHENRNHRLSAPAWLAKDAGVRRRARQLER